MDDRRQEHRRRLAEFAAEDRLRRAAAEPEIARKEAALAEAQARLARTRADNEALEVELDAARAEAEDVWGQIEWMRTAGGKRPSAAARSWPAGGTGTSSPLFALTTAWPSSAMTSWSAAGGRTRWT